MKTNICQIIKNRLVVICSAVLMMFVLAGCNAGSTVDTTLVLEKDLSGVRQMTIVIDDSVFSQYFNGTVEDINALMDTSCPQELTWSYSEAGGTKQYSFELAFSSLDDYKEKVAAILGYEPEITISTPDSVWANGISVTENFKDTDLLQWMRDLLVDNGFVDSSNASNIFSSGTLNVSYNDSTYRSNSTSINVNEVEYVALDDIHILTDINGWNNYSRRVVFRIPSRSMDLKGDAIEEYLNGLVPANSKSEWGEDEGETVFTVSISNVTAEQLAAFDLTVFDSENASVVRTDVSENFSPFTFGEYLQETLDLRNFATGEYWAQIHYTYQVRAAISYTATHSSDGLRPGYEGADSALFSGYKVLVDSYANDYDESEEFHVLTQRSYSVKEMDVETDQGWGSKWERTVKFVFETVPSEDDINTIVTRMEALAGIGGADSDDETSQDTEETESEDVNVEEKSGPKAAEVKISQSTKDDVFTLSIKQKGSLEEIKISSGQIFGYEGELSYAKDREFWKVKKQEAFTESIRFGNLLDNVSSDFKIYYTADMGMLSSMQYCSSDTAEMDGSKLKVTFNSTRVNVTYVGTEINPLAILFWVFIAVGVIFLCIFILKLVMFISKSKPAAPKPAAPTAQTAPAAEAAQTAPAAEAAPTAQETQAAQAVPAVPTPVQTVSQEAEQKAEQPVQSEEQKTQQPESAPAGRFCEKCGTPREPGAKFCEKCGTKFED